MTEEKKIKPMVYQSERKIELLHREKYKDYNFYILNLGTHPTAYIEIPKGHLLYGKDYNEIYEMNCDIDVNGGLTYSDKELMGIESKNWFIGWDYAHAGDYMGFYEDFNKWGRNTLNSFNFARKWTTEQIIEDCKNAIDYIIKWSEENEHTDR